MPIKRVQLERLICWYSVTENSWETPTNGIFIPNQVSCLVLITCSNNVFAHIKSMPCNDEPVCIPIILFWYSVPVVRIRMLTYDNCIAYATSLENVRILPGYFSFIVFYSLFTSLYNIIVVLSQMCLSKRDQVGQNRWNPAKVICIFLI